MSGIYPFTPEIQERAADALQKAEKKRPADETWVEFVNRVQAELAGYGLEIALRKELELPPDL